LIAKYVPLLRELYWRQGIWKDWNVLYQNGWL
jgi:hypothetical protein